MAISSDSLRVVGIGTLLYDGHLSVPINQRSYAWTKEHVQDLLDDISRAFGADEYFLGSVVLTSGNSGRKEVVDGQQRLATTTLLIAAIRDFLVKQGDDKRATNIESKYLFETDDITLDVNPRLVLNVDDNDYFRKRVLLRADEEERKTAKPFKPSHERIDVAAKMALSHVHKIGADLRMPDRIKRLMEYVAYIKEEAKVISVVVPDEAGAYVIFETLNDRGLDLSKSDLLKNYLFGKAGNERIREAQTRWASMTGALESVSKEDITVTYIRHLWISLNGHVRERELYKKIRDSLDTKQKAIDFAGSLSQNAFHYAALLNSDHEKWGSFGTTTRRQIKTLILLAIERLRPLLLAVSTNFPQKEAEKAFGLAVSWSVRFIIAGAPAGTVEQHIASTAPNVSNKTIKTAAELAKAMTPIVPKDTEFQDAFSVASVSQGYLARYYLRSLEKANANESDAAYIDVNDDERIVTLEHILPENLPDPLPVVWQHMTREEIDGLKRRIGNLCLLTAKPNVSIDQGDFLTVKVPVYAKCPLKLTKDIASAYTRWSSMEIKARQIELSKLAVKAWPI
jgi:hypothetical protein